jgi:hypothetical protein
VSKSIVTPERRKEMPLFNEQLINYNLISVDPANFPTEQAVVYYFISFYQAKN